jgi:glycosyltransferase involved in cell wall biosynthesis
MRIGIDIRALRATRTGIGRYLLKMLEALAAGDRANEYILFYNSLKGETPDDIPTADNFKTVRIRMPNKLLNVFWAYTPLPPVESFIGPVDIFHSPNFQLAPARTGASVLTVHDLVFYLHPEMAIPSSVRHYKPRIHHYFKRADMVVADSKATARDIVEHLDFPEDRIAVIYPGAITMEEASRERIETMKSRYAIENDYILFVSCLEPRKNLARLFKAFDRSGLHDQYQLVLAGPKGWHFRELEVLWNSLDSRSRIRWLDYVPGEELSALYSGAAFFVYPSLVEGFGLPILEAMSVGCPVLTSDVSSMPEVAGEAALYVDPLDVDSIIDGLIQLASDSTLRERLSRDGRERVKLFTWDKMAKSMLGIYERGLELKNYRK